MPSCPWGATMDGFVPPKWIVRLSAATILWSGLGWCDHDVFAQHGRVGGLDELVILDPGKHDRGLPAVDLVPSPIGTQIDIAPTTHVHRFYYNGDKEYQGPLIQGGPTIVVATHPRTSKRMYIDVNLPSGAPIIVYDKCSITYVYQDRRVVIGFAPLSDERASVTYLPGRGICRVKHEHIQAVKQKHVVAAQQHGLSHAVHDVGASMVKTVSGGIGTVGKVTSEGLTNVKKAVEGLPPVTQLQSIANQRAERGLREANSQAQKLNELKNPDFIKTNR